jgi:hypothetical protein
VWLDRRASAIEGESTVKGGERREERGREGKGRLFWLIYQRLGTSASANL